MYPTHRLDFQESTIAPPSRENVTALTDPRSNCQLAMLGGIRVPCSPRQLDQGSVVVLCRRSPVLQNTYISAIEKTHAKSIATYTIAVKIPQCTTSDPRSTDAYANLRDHRRWWIRDQSQPLQAIPKGLLIMAGICPN